MPKNVKGGHFGIFRTSILLQNRKQLKGDLLETLKKFTKKSHKAEITCKKNFGQERDSNPHPSAWQTSKNPN